MTRSRSLTIAALLQLLLSAISVVIAVAALPGALAGSAAAANTPPYPVLMLTLVIGAAGLVSAYGLWKNQKWAKVLTIILRTLDLLSALPGLIAAPSNLWRATAAISIVLSVLIIFLVLRREPTFAAA